MDGRIGHLHCCYRAFHDHDAADTMIDRLEQLASTHVLEAYSQALDQVFGDDPTVYILRHARFSFALLMGGTPADFRLGQVWGEKMAGAVVRAIAGDHESGQNLIRFTNQADYVAHFVIDLLAGRAWEHWFYGAFATLKPLSQQAALHEILRQNRDHLPTILRCLEQNKALETLLSALAPAMIQSLWDDGLEQYSASFEPTTEALRPLFVQALRLVDALDLWARLPSDENALFETYWRSGPLPPDWRDRRALTASVLHVLFFLAERAYLVRDQGQCIAGIDRAAPDFSWLDLAWLREQVSGLLTRREQQPPDLPARRFGEGATPRQSELLADLITVLRGQPPRLARSEPDSPANAMRLYAALIAHAPRWSGEPVVAGLIDRLIKAWARVAESAAPYDVLDHLRRGGVEGALQILPAERRKEAVPVFRFLAALGEPGIVLMSALLEGDSAVKASTSPSGFPIAADINSAEIAVEVAARSPDLLVEAILRPTDCDTIPTGDGAADRDRTGKTITGSAEEALPTVIPQQAAKNTWQPTTPYHEYPSMETVIDTQCAGIFLLWRAITDIRLPAHLELNNLKMLLATLGMHWAGRAALAAEQLDPALSIFAGLNNTLTSQDVADFCARFDIQPVQVALFKTLAAQRLVQGSTLYRHILPLEHCRAALVAGSETAGIWPLCQLGELPGIPSEWLSIWQSATGRQPAILESGDAHHANYQALLETLRALSDGQPELSGINPTTMLIAAALLRVWARWLRQFANSSTSYLLNEFVRRAGRLTIDSHRIQVEMDSRPLDIVIQMADYMAPLNAISWIDRKRVEFKIRGT